MIRLAQQKISPNQILVGSTANRVQLVPEKGKQWLTPDIMVSVVVATYDRPDDLRSCLQSLMSQETARPIEIIVVDNHPASGLTRPVVAEFPGVALVCEPRQGLAYARNAGFVASRGEIVVATDDDVTMPLDWLEKLVAPFVQSEVMIVTGNVLPLTLDTEAQRLFEAYGGLGRGGERKEVSADWFHSFRFRAVPTWQLGATANAAFRTTIFSHPQIGLMDEALGPGMPSGVGEDTYLFYKVLQAGFTLIYEPEAYVWHKHRRDMAALRRQIYAYSKGHIAYHLTTLLRDRDWRVLLHVFVLMPPWRMWKLIQLIFGKLSGSANYSPALLLVEIAGNLAGPWALWRSHRRVRREGLSGPYRPVFGLSQTTVEEIPLSLSMPETALVSVIIPCYNQADFLAEAIESVKAQNYPYVEIIVVDDGSTDNTAEVAARYPEVRYIRQPNQGLSAARNTGLKYSTGCYLVFLDADDRLLPDALEINLERLNNRPECAFIFGSFRLISREGIAYQTKLPSKFTEVDYAALLQGNHIGMHATVMYRREVFDTVGGYNTLLRACEDYDLYLRIARQFPIARHDYLVAEYRQHGLNMSHNSVLMLTTVLSVLQAQKPYLKENGQYQRAYQKGIRNWTYYYGQQIIKKAQTQFKAGAWQNAALALIIPMKQIVQLFSAKIHKKLKGGRDLLTRYWRRINRLPVGQVDFGSLRQITPIEANLETVLEQPIDRYYAERFLKDHAGDIQGAVLEIGNGGFIPQLGVYPTTVVTDPILVGHLPLASYDCIILPQVLYRIYDIKAALQTICRLLKPGGVLLATLPGIRLNNKRDSSYWAFTSHSARHLFADIFRSDDFTVSSYGNVLAATSYLHGIGANKLHSEELDSADPQYQVLIGVRAVKPGHL